MAYIYKITNTVNGKSYIGKTTFSIDKRWKQHINKFKQGVDRHFLIYSAIEEYGLENFVVEEIEKVKDVYQLNEREKYWIKYFDTYNNGYNGNKGGGKELTYDYNTIFELWQSNYKIKEIAKIIGCNEFVVRSCLNSYDITTEERIQRSMDDQIASHEPYKREVLQFDISANKLLNVYSSVSEAAKTIKCDKSYLSRVCRKNGIAFGFLWCYSDKTYKKKDFSAKRVCQIDLTTGKIINIYNSLTKAAEAVNGNTSYISKVCKGKQHSSKGFGWKFEYETKQT